MTWILVAVIVVLAVALAWLFRRQRDAWASARTATAATEEAKARVAQARKEASDADARLDAAQAGAEQAAQTQAQALAIAEDRMRLAESGLIFARQEAAASTARAHLETLWTLACLEQGRAERMTMPLPGDGAAGPPGLAAAIAHEVERIREETGTPGQLSVTLQGELAAGDAVIALRALQGLLAVLTRYSEAFELRVGAEAGRLVATVVCDGFDGPDTVADEATALLRALRPALGEIDVDRDEGGRLEATLTIPLAR